MKKFVASILAVLMLAAMAPNAFAAIDKSPTVPPNASEDYTVEKSPTVPPNASGDYTVEKSPTVPQSASSVTVDDYAPPVSPGVLSATVDDKAPTVVPNTAAKNSSAKIPPAGLEERVLKWRAYNRDTIGWLNIPDTKINQPVMWYPDDNNAFYLRRNEKRESDFNGCYFADYRCDYKNYTLPQYTTIYGHSMSDDPKDERFSQLRKFLDDGFAKSHPYIYFSDGNKTYTFRVFAVYTTTVDTPYNVPNLDAETRKKVIDEAVELSVRDYGYKPGTEEKILTLSTATYSLTDGTPLYFPNRSRFVVMAYAVKNPNQPAPAAAISSQKPMGYEWLYESIYMFMSQNYNYKVSKLDISGDSKSGAINMELEPGVGSDKLDKIARDLLARFGGDHAKEHVKSYMNFIRVTSGGDGVDINLA